MYDICIYSMCIMLLCLLLLRRELDDRRLLILEISLRLHQETRPLHQLANERLGQLQGCFRDWYTRHWRPAEGTNWKPGIVEHIARRLLADCVLGIAYHLQHMWDAALAENWDMTQQTTALGHDLAPGHVPVHVEWQVVRARCRPRSGAVLAAGQLLECVVYI